MPDLRSMALIAVRIALSTALLAAVGWIAHLPLGAPDPNAALRLSLRAPHARVEICREPGAEELAALPAHMRQSRICEFTTVDYQLVVRVDGEERLSQRLVHHGVRSNRPLVVDRLLSIAPGAHRVTIDLAPIVPGGREQELATLASYRSDDEIRFPRGRIQIATLSDDRLVWVAD